MAAERALRVGYVVKMFPRLSETFILNEILELERQGVEVTIFSIKKPNEGRFHPQLSELQARVLYLDELDTKKWAVWLARDWSVLAHSSKRLWALLEEAIAEGDPGRVDSVWWGAWVAARALEAGLDHLHAHFASLPSTVAYCASRIAAIPYSLTAHAKDIFVYGPDEHYLRTKLRTAARVVTVTEYNRRYLYETMPEEASERITVLNNGIDVELFKPDPAVAREPGLIVSVGRLVPKKGYHILLDALAILKAEGVPFRCEIAGDGNQAEALADQRRELGLEAEVALLGARHRDEVLPLMHRASVMCLPCTVDGDNNVDALPTVLLEALACELPVVSTRVSGIPEIVDHEQNGLLVDADDPRQLSDALKRLLAAPELLRTYGMNGRRKALERFDLRVNVATLRGIFEASRDDRAAAPAEVSSATRVEVTRDHG